MTPQTVAHQAPLPMEFSRQAYRSGLPFLSPGTIPVPGIKPTFPALAGGFFTTEPPGKPGLSIALNKKCWWKRVIRKSISRREREETSKLFTWLTPKTSFFRPSVQFSSISQSCPTLWDPMNHSTPGLRLSPTPGDYSNPCPLSWWCHPAISSSVIPFSCRLNPSQHQGLFQWVNSSHQVAKVRDFQLQHQSFQWTLGTDVL